VVKNLHRCHSHLEKLFSGIATVKRGKKSKPDMFLPKSGPPCTVLSHYESSLEGEPRARAERSERDRARHRRQGDKHWSRVPAARARDDPENVSSYPHLAGYRCTGRAPREKANIVMARFKHTVTTYLRSRSQVML